MQESSTAFDHQQPSKSKRRNLDLDAKDLKSLATRESSWTPESFKLPDIRFTRKAAKTVRRAVKGKMKRHIFTDFSCYLLVFEWEKERVRSWKNLDKCRILRCSAVWHSVA